MAVEYTFEKESDKYRCIIIAKDTLLRRLEPYLYSEEQIYYVWITLITGPIKIA